MNLRAFRDALRVKVEGEVIAAAADAVVYWGLPAERPPASGPEVYAYWTEAAQPVDLSSDLGGEIQQGHQFDLLLILVHPNPDGADTEGELLDLHTALGDELRGARVEAGQLCLEFESPILATSHPEGGDWRVDLRCRITVEVTAPLN